MAYNFKSIADVEVVAEPTENANVLIEENGVIKKAPKTAVGGASGSNDEPDMIIEITGYETENVTIVKGTYNDIIAIRESGGIPNIRVVANMYKNESYYWSPIGNYQGYAAYYYGDLYVSAFIFDSYYGGGPRYVVVDIGSNNIASNIYFNDF